jgi:low affinity Fe/Cu permease
MGRERAYVRLIGLNDDRDLHDGANRDARALHLKLDELLRGMKAARNKLIDLEHCTDEAIDQIERQFQALRRRDQCKKANGRRKVSTR